MNGGGVPESHVAANVVIIGRRLLVWLVAATATLHAIGDAVVALLDGRLGPMLVWSAIAVAIAFFAAAIETR